MVDDVDSAIALSAVKFIFGAFQRRAAAALFASIFLFMPDCKSEPGEEKDGGCKATSAGLEENPPTKTDDDNGGRQQRQQVECRWEDKIGERRQNKESNSICSTTPKSNVTSGPTLLTCGQSKQITSRSSSTTCVSCKSMWFASKPATAAKPKVEKLVRWSGGLVGTAFFPQ